MRKYLVILMALVAWRLPSAARGVGLDEPGRWPARRYRSTALEGGSTDGRGLEPGYGFRRSGGPYPTIVTTRTLRWGASAASPVRSLDKP